MKDLILENIKGKYFQDKTHPLKIIKGPLENQLNLRPLINGESVFSFWAPLEKTNYAVSLDQMENYIEISEEEASQIKNLYTKRRFKQIENNLYKKLEENNKPNLSEQNSVNKG